MAEEEKPKAKKDFKDPVEDENGILTYDLKPHDAMMIVKWEFNFKKSTNE